MHDVGHSLGFGLTPFRSARFSSNQATSARAVIGATKDKGMNALVCYPTRRTLRELVAALDASQQFSQILQYDTIEDLQQATRRYPDAIVFADLSTIRRSERCISNRHDWIILGESNSDALEAFSTHAMSFLRTPLDEAQVDDCLRHLHQLHQTRVRQQQFSALKSGLCQQYGIGEAALAAMLRRQSRVQEKPDVVGVRSGNSWCCVSASEVRWIEAAGDYKCVHTDVEQHIVRSTLGALTRRFADTEFVHCNRSTVINVAYLHALVWVAPAMLVAELADGTRLKISRRCYAAYWQHHPLASQSQDDKT